jgi:predicted RNA-binding protein with TRAM domain
MYGNNRNMGGGRRPQAQFSPVKEGEEIDVKIEAVGEKGDGIAKKNGFVIFVPGVQENDEVRIRVTRVLKKVGFAEVIGKALGPIAAPTERKQQQPTVKAPEPEPEHEDSENFGEESEAEDEFDDEPEAEEAEADDLGEDSEDNFDKVEDEDKN